MEYNWAVTRTKLVENTLRKWCNGLGELYTLKLTRAELSANAGNFTWGPHVKRPHTQFTCATCSLPVKTSKITHVYAASTSRTRHANCLQPQVNLPEYNGYFTSNFTCGTHANLPATSMQNCLLCRQNTCNCQEKTRAIAGNLLSHRG